jgi:hypothetical protein
LQVGMSTVAAILGNKVIPGLLDHYLARRAYDAQQTDEPADPTRPDNLFQPVPGSFFAAHGRFDDRSRPGSLELWLSMHVQPLLLAAGLAGALGVAGALGLRRARR